MRIFGGLKSEDWRAWGKRTTFKSNVAGLLARELRADQVVYCSPLVDPYQPAEREERLMPNVLEAVIAAPPRVFTLQTRAPLILRDLDLLLALAARTKLHISFSITTDRDDVRKLYEPHCEPIDERFAALAALRDAGLEAHATLAPLLPCDPERLADRALASSDADVICDPFHVREVKRRGATTRPEAERISAAKGFEQWHDPPYQAEVVERLRERVEAAGRGFGVGPSGFARLARC